MIPSSFSDNTGNTQGIRLRMNPPRRAMARIPRSSPRSSVSVPAPTVRRVSSIRDGDASPFTSLSTRVTISGMPTRERFFLSSPGEGVTPAAKISTTTRSPASLRTFGAPAQNPGGPSTKTSTSPKGRSERAVMRSRPFSPVPSASTRSTASSPPSCESGTSAA